MACLLVPAAEAVVTTIATKIIESKEKEATKNTHSSKTSFEMQNRIPFSQKLKWLNHLLWGGSGLLAFEHLWHGEIVPWFPFLTAANNPADTVEMLHEISTVGVTMAVLVTGIWLCMLGISNIFEKRIPTTITNKEV